MFSFILLLHLRLESQTGRIVQFPFLRSQALAPASVSVKSALYGKNCHVPCAIEGAAISLLDLSHRAANFFRAARRRPLLLPVFCPAVSGWLPNDRFEGESRMSYRADEPRSRMKHTLENRRPLRQHAIGPVSRAANNASAAVILEAYLCWRRRNCVQLNRRYFRRFIDTSMGSTCSNDPIITSIWQLEE